MKQQIKVAVTDDHGLFRRGLISLLKEFDELEIIIEASSGYELLEAVKRKKPHVVLLDYEMPGMDGAETTRQLRAKYPEIKVLILTMHNEEQIILHLVESGAHGFLQKDYNIEVVVDAIYSVMETGCYFNNTISKAIIRNLLDSKKIKPVFERDNTLTERELQILKLICGEFTNKEIAEKLFIAASTVSTHRESILEKTGARNTAGLVLYAIKTGLIQNF